MFNHKKDKNQDKSEGVKSDFITVASHQLRTPMSAVRWSLDTLLSGRTGKLSEKQKEVVKEAYRNNSFMVKVVNDLLKISRVEEKGLNLVPERVDIIKIINEVIKENKDFAKAFNCKIILKKPTKFSKAYIDPLQIKPVIRALIDNAIRYSKIKTDNNIQISLNKLGKFLLLKIKDQGIGIPEKQKQLIFSKFFRGNNAIKIQTEGIGLDLYLAKIVIESSGGKIDFKSTENKGTIFNIYLPTTEKQFLSVKKEQEEEEPEDILKKEREFVSITVHELKAPLGVTKWSLEMLKSKKPGSLTSDQIELIDQIYRGNERLLTLVRDLLNLSKLQEGKFEIESRSIKFEEVVEHNLEKMVRRHPHVFGDTQADSPEMVKDNWEKIKKKEKGETSRQSILASISQGLPALLRASLVSERAAKTGFDWEDLFGVMEKAKEEWLEFSDEVKRLETKDGKDNASTEFGDILFTLVNVARFAGIHPETALIQSIKKFEKRFFFMEEKALEMGRQIESMSIQEMHTLWAEAKDRVG